MEVAQTSEEIQQIDTALTHCKQLKIHLNDAMLHIQRLNAKYNDIDYMAVIRNLESSLNQSNTTPSSSSRKRQLNRSMDELLDHQSTPVVSKKQADIRRCIQKTKLKALTSTPKQLHYSQQLLNDSNVTTLTSSSNNDDDDSTPKRSMRELKQNNNTITVRTLKVQRNIEAILTHLQVMQKTQERNHRHQLEQSIYQNCPNASCGSPGHLGHSSCMENSLNSFISMNNSCNDPSLSTSIHNYSNNNCNNNHSQRCTPTKKRRRTTVYDYQQHTLQKVQRFYATPLERLHKRLIHLNASLIRSC